MFVIVTHRVGLGKRGEVSDFAGEQDDGVWNAYEGLIGAQFNGNRVFGEQVSGGAWEPSEDLHFEDTGRVFEVIGGAVGRCCFGERSRLIAIDDAFEFAEGADALELQQFQVVAGQGKQVVDPGFGGIELGIPWSECFAPDVDGLAGDDDRLDVDLIELDEDPVEIFGGMTFGFLTQARTGLQSSTSIGPGVMSFFFWICAGVAFPERTRRSSSRRDSPLALAI